MKAYCLIRTGPAYRHDAFVAGLRRAGYEVCNQIPKNPQPDDVLVIWNRYGTYDRAAAAFEQAGASVIVAENGYLGREWRGSYWYAMSLGRHNGAGQWFYGGPERWDRWGIDVRNWRTAGDHVLLVPQRGIGVPPVCQPRGWKDGAVKRLDTNRRVVCRDHPGEKKSHETLYCDLQDAHCVVTWGSGAALKALVHGVPVFYDFPDWIGRDAAVRYDGTVEKPFLGDRLPALRRLAWAMWSVGEIATGEPFDCLLNQISRAA